MPCEIRLDNVCKKFGNADVLRNVSVDFQAGLIHGIIGRNGSGKTVMLKCICGLIRDYSGSITINGIERKHIKLGKINIGAIIEAPGFVSGYSGLDNLRFLGNIRGAIKKERMVETMHIVGLDPESRKHVEKYSLGMRQRLGLAQALMEDPELLVLDEPFNGLDNTGVREMRELLLGLRGQGRTILIASHNMEDINQLCDTKCEMDAGQLVVT